MRSLRQIAMSESHEMLPTRSVTATGSAKTSRTEERRGYSPEKSPTASRAPLDFLVARIGFDSCHPIPPLSSILTMQDPSTGSQDSRITWSPSLGGSKELIDDHRRIVHFRIARALGTMLMWRFG